MFDDGSAPNPNIRIERVCFGMVRFEAHTDTKGRFSFQLGQNNLVDLSAEDTTPGSLTGGGNSLSPQMGTSRSGSLAANQLAGCELRASYPGYRSDLIELATRRSMDDPRVGTIVLHRLANVTGSTLSLTTALAPKHAQKDYEKGLRLESKGDFAAAETHLQQATEAYPKYAAAWFALGETEQKEGKIEPARKSYENAIAADNKFVSPYGNLALLSAQAGKWQEVADYTSRVIQLNPVEFPGAFWLNALANYRLGKAGEAEHSAKQLLQVDTAHKFPEGERLLAQLLFDKGNSTEAATHLRAYVALHPGGDGERTAREFLAKIDQANTEARK